MQINQGVAWEGVNIVYKDILLRAPWISDNPAQDIYFTKHIYSPKSFILLPCEAQAPTLVLDNQQY